MFVPISHVCLSIRRIIRGVQSPCVFVPSQRLVFENAGGGGILCAMQHASITAAKQLLLAAVVSGCFLFPPDKLIGVASGEWPGKRAC